MTTTGARIRLQSDTWTTVRRDDGTVARVGVTLGDAAGIGPEVLIQALLHTHLQRRVAISIFVPVGACACHLIAPHAATVCASRTSDVYVPRAARSEESRKILPGFDVANITRALRSGNSVVT